MVFWIEEMPWIMDITRHLNTVGIRRILEVSSIQMVAISLVMKWLGFWKVGSIAMAVIDVYSSPNHLKTGLNEKILPNCPVSECFRYSNVGIQIVTVLHIMVQNLEAIWIPDNIWHLKSEQVKVCYSYASAIQMFLFRSPLNQTPENSENVLNTIRFHLNYFEIFF